MERRFGSTTLVLEKGDITKLDVDAIVNAANSALMGGGGVDGAIHRAGGRAIKHECQKLITKIGRLAPGQAVITSGGELLARNVIHTVGPVWQGDPEPAGRILASAYRNSLALADKMALATLAFPSISTGAYGYPVPEAAAVALQTVKNYLEGGSHLQQVIFALFSDQDFETYKKVLSTL